VISEPRWPLRRSALRPLGLRARASAAGSTGGGRYRIAFGLPTGRALAVVCMGLLGGLLGAAPATAAVWAAQTVPAASADGFGQLTAVSCSAPRTCVAVGSAVSRASGQVTIAERWNGSQWSLQATPPPASAFLGDEQKSSLAGVSCGSRSACVAVGSTGWSAGGGSAGKSALLERWDGHTWSIAQPQGTAVDDALNGVSCVSARFCVAVGVLTMNDTTGVSLPLFERWNGRRWARGTAPAPHGASLSVLDGVSCSSRDSCTAVGSFSSDAGCTNGAGPCIGRALVERFNGRRWSIQPLRGTLEAENAG
jgi:hypothetical protein